MRQLKNSLLAMCSLILFSACERIVEIEIPSDEPKLVIESQITNDNAPWTVYLSLSQPYFDQDATDAISDAIVTITGTDGSNVTLNQTGPGVFRSTLPEQCKVGEQYTLNVVYKGETYTATERMANAFPIDLIQSYYLPDDNGFIEKGYYVFIQGKENEAKGDYYLFKAYRNDTLKDENGSNLDSDEFGSISYLNEKFDAGNILEELAKGKIPRPFPFSVLPDDTIRIEQYAITKQYYQFILDLEAQLRRSGTPFDPPPANPNNNISNGGLGYFSVAHKETATLIVKE